AGDRTVLEVILRVRDRGPRGADGLDHGRKDLLAVEQHLDRVPRGDGRARVRLEGGEERGLSELHVRQQHVWLHAPARRDGQTAGEEDDESCLDSVFDGVLDGRGGGVEGRDDPAFELAVTVEAVTSSRSCWSCPEHWS